MKYFFDAFMFVKGANSPCYTATENLVVSSQDLVGVRFAYPSAAGAVASEKANLENVLRQITSAPNVPAVVREDMALRLNTPAPH